MAFESPDDLEYAIRTGKVKAKRKVLVKCPTCKAERYEMRQVKIGGKAWASEVCAGCLSKRQRSSLLPPGLS